MAHQLPLALSLREGSTLANFVAGESNLPAVHGVDAVLSGSDRQAFIWGEREQGKSHLLEGAVRQVRECGGNACLLPASELLPLVPDVLEGMEHFDLLALDDCDQFAGHAQWEEAIFHLYNRLMSAQGTLLATGSAAPAALGLMLPDLATRLAAGPVYRLNALDEDALVQLVTDKAQERGMRIERDVARFIVMRAERRPGALLALLEKLDPMALAQQRSVTIPFVKAALGW